MNQPRWTLRGPTNLTGRMNAIVGHPTAIGTVYAGADGGGVWKTVDGGATWRPLTDGTPIISITALALAPSRPETIYAGTGQRGGPIGAIPGVGLVTSHDGGATWHVPHAAVADSFQAIAVHPNHAHELVVACDQGILRTTNGGKHWAHATAKLFAIDLVRAPGDSARLFATTFRQGLLASHDRGASWSDVTASLPIPPAAQVQAMLAVGGRSIFLAAYDFTVPNQMVTILRSDNDGVTWATVGHAPHNRNFAVLRASSTNPGWLFAGEVTSAHSEDGGATWAPVGGAPTPHADMRSGCHQGATLYIATDGGIWASADNGRSFVERNGGLTTSQFYAAAIDPLHPDRIFGTTQDNGCWTRRDSGGLIWVNPIGGDGSIGCEIEPQAPSTGYLTTVPGSTGGQVFWRADSPNGAPPPLTDITPPLATGEVSYALPVMALDQANPGTIYFATHRLWRSPDRGVTWHALPTTTIDGTTWSNATRVVVLAVDPSLILLAKESSNFRDHDIVVRSTDGGATWSSAASGLGNALVTGLAIDPTDANVAYAALCAPTGPSLYASSDGGLTWAPSPQGLPPNKFCRVVRVDPVDPQRLYAGTDAGPFHSNDGGGRWHPLGHELPPCAVYDLRVVVEPGGRRRLCIATYGRAVWELHL